MVTTRRKAAADPDMSQAAVATEREMQDAPTVRKAARRKAVGRTPSAAKTAEPTITTTEAVATASTTTNGATTNAVAAMRRTRSKQTASPLKSLDYVQHRAPASSAKSPAPRATPLKTKRRHGASHYARASASASATPEPEAAAAAQDESQDEQGIFFTQNTENSNVSPKNEFVNPTVDSIPHVKDPVPYPHESSLSDPTPVSPTIPPASPQLDPITPKGEAASPQLDPVSPYASPPQSLYAERVPPWVRIDAEMRESSAPPPPFFTGHVATDDPEKATMREENFLLRAQVVAVQQRNFRLIGDNQRLKSIIFSTERQIAELQKFLPPPREIEPVQADFLQPDIHSFGIDTTMLNGDEGLIGSDSAFELLHKIESAAREPRTVQPAPNDEDDAQTQSLSQQPRYLVGESETARSGAEATPAPIPDKSESFFSRSFSALKRSFGFSTRTPVQLSPTPAARVPPPPESFTEILSTPPTPVGERRKTRPKKNPQNTMLKLLTKGVEPADMAKAEAWAKHIIPTLKNYPDFDAKRRRLETPVLVQDLDQFPSSKPWESGFGDPLGDLEDDAVVPVWAVVQEILAEEEEPKRKKMKPRHEVDMVLEDTLSLNDIDRASPDLQDSHGQSASIRDLHPRRSVEPSPMFSSLSPHQPGGNIFGELRENDVTKEAQADARETLQEATKRVPTHNPSKGSFGLDYDSDDDDSTVLEDDDDASSAGEAASPLWTQPPPPAPVPSHAPLPSGSSATNTPAAVDPPSAAASEQPVDEVERQRQKLMKHTPAKPSRLREAFVPSPSVMSDAGNQSLFMGTPMAPAAMFDDMPDAEDLDLEPDVWAAVEAFTNTAEWKAANAANNWPDPTYTYESEEEELSPV
ncbi:hypothetical protein ACEQ8H_000664 [Pleosporales sp. CAS-2024a]